MAFVSKCKNCGKILFFSTVNQCKTCKEKNDRIVDVKRAAKTYTPTRHAPPSNPSSGVKTQTTHRSNYQPSSNTTSKCNDDNDLCSSIVVSSMLYNNTIDDVISSSYTSDTSSYFDSGCSSSTDTSTSYDSSTCNNDTW